MQRLLLHVGAGCLAGFLTLALVAFGAPVLAIEPVDLELILAIDVSGSIDPDEARLQREGYVAAFLHPDVLRAIQDGYNGSIAVTYFEWSDDQSQRVIVDWTLIRSAADARAFAGSLAESTVNIGRRTSISSAIQYALPMFETNDYVGIRRVIDISGDGENNAGIPVVAARDLAIAKGVTINGLPIVNDRPNRFGFPQMPNLDRYYANCVIGGNGAFLVVANNFESFAEAVRRKLILEIADLQPDEPKRHAARPARHPLLHYVQGVQSPSEAPDSYDCSVGERRMFNYFQRNIP